MYVQSVLPVREEAIGIHNQDVQALNEAIHQLADAHGMTYIDVYSTMVDESNMLFEAYSYDGVHLTAAAYEAWQNLLAPYVDE